MRYDVARMLHTNDIEDLAPWKKMSYTENASRVPGTFYALDKNLFNDENFPWNHAIFMLYTYHSSASAGAINRVGFFAISFTSYLSAIGY